LEIRTDGDVILVGRVPWSEPLFRFPPDGI
jgi:hypothetical protein